jgi:hypothetical protein
LAPNAKLRPLVVPQQPPAQAQAASEAAAPAECEVETVQARPNRISWARLLKRVFVIDMQHCPNCGGGLKIIAAILERPVIEKILSHLSRAGRHKHLAPVCAAGSNRGSLLNVVRGSVPDVARQSPVAFPVPAISDFPGAQAPSEIPRALHLTGPTGRVLGMGQPRAGEHYPRSLGE